jgi:hypothetical protein
LETPENVQIWRAVLSSFFVIEGYVWFLIFSVIFFEFHHEFFINSYSDDKIVPAAYSENNKGLNNKVKRL